MAHHPYIGLRVQKGQGKNPHDDRNIARKGGPWDYFGLKVKCNKLRRNVGDHYKDEVQGQHCPSREEAVAVAQ